jgi:predicted anti-sigma-YlaC factor YlaD
MKIPFRLTCKEAHRLVSEELDRTLSPGERLRVRMHLFACHSCSRFGQQVALLRSAMRRMTD